MKIINNLIINYFDTQKLRDTFVIEQLNKIKKNTKILDAGCGNQRYKINCSHLNYKSQDFGKYKNDIAESFTDGAGGENGYYYGEIDYLGDIWEINEEDNYFDTILCTEVFEHIAYPVDTIKEFARLLKPGGKLILTAPSNCLRHMDPYYYYSGFSNNWYEEVLKKYGFIIDDIKPVGDYYWWLAVEIGRAGRHHGLIGKIILAPAFIYFFFKKPTAKSINTLCFGYHVSATKS